MWDLPPPGARWRENARGSGGCARSPSRASTREKSPSCSSTRKCVRASRAATPPTVIDLRLTGSRPTGASMVPAVGREASVYQREVAAVDVAPPHHGHEATMHLSRLGDDQQPGSVFVEPVHAPGPETALRRPPRVRAARARAYPRRGPATDAPPCPPACPPRAATRPRRGTGTSISSGFERRRSGTREDHAPPIGPPIAHSSWRARLPSTSTGPVGDQARHLRTTTDLATRAQNHVEPPASVLGPYRELERSGALLARFMRAASHGTITTKWSVRRPALQARTACATSPTTTRRCRRR